MKTVNPKWRKSYWLLASSSCHWAKDGIVSKSKTKWHPGRESRGISFLGFHRGVANSTGQYIVSCQDRCLGLSQERLPRLLRTLQHAYPLCSSVSRSLFLKYRLWILTHTHKLYFGFYTAGTILDTQEAAHPRYTWSGSYVPETILSVNRGAVMGQSLVSCAYCLVFTVLLWYNQYHIPQIIKLVLGGKQRC